MINTAVVKARRELLKLTMLEAAQRAGMKTRMDWNKLENGARPDPNASTLQGIARVLQCTMDELMLPPKTKPAKPQK